MFNINDKVKITNTNLYGKICRIYNNICIVKINNKKVKIDENKLQLFNYPETNTRSSVTYDIDKNKDFSNEIMLRHKTKDEAIYELDKFIDDCISNEVKIVRIIHGKNGGVLRKAVHEYLRHNKYVESYKLGGYFEGQFGVTIANLK
ncbi:MAG: Smr/MutS family protein [Clostridia bacterium]